MIAVKHRRKGKWFGLLLSAALVVGMLPAMNVKADLGGWTTASNGVMTITGTNVTVRISGSTIYVEGYGEIPDYEPATYTKRPWHYFDFDRVIIGDGITRIGKYAFADKTSLKRIDMRVSTFVADGSCFRNIASNPIMRISGATQATKVVGSITYGSLESIIANAPSGRECAFIVDNANMIYTLRNMVYPYLKYVYDAGDSSAPWDSRKDMTKDVNYTRLGTAVTDNGNTFLQVQKKPQGELYMEAISYWLKDYTYLCSYSMTLEDRTGTVIYGTNGNRRYTLKLDDKDRIYNRQYCLIEIGPDAQIMYLEDLDSNYDTVTFETYYPTSTYALVYKYPMPTLP